jgi:hypothetical protein
MALGQPLSGRAQTFGSQALAQLADGGLEQTAVAILLVGLAITLEPAPLIQVEQRPAEAMSQDLLNT